MTVSVCELGKDVTAPAAPWWAALVRAAASPRNIAFASALAVILPILVILSSFLHPEPRIWRHIAGTLLGGLVKNTLALAAGVLAGTGLLGVGAAWLTAVCDFPGRRFFSWALMLPLAVPTYVLAFVFIGLLDFSGPVQAFLRARVTADMAWFPEIRSTGGVVLVMSLALYPYVYLLAGSAFLTQGRRVMEVSQVLGHSPGRAFFKAALPMARPWIAAGLMLVLMETLADFGAVSVFNYDTFTTGIYKAWFGFFSISAAAQLSSLLLVVVFLAVVVEQRMRARMQYVQVGRMTPEARRIRLSGRRGWAAAGALTLLLLAAFVVPCAQLLAWSVEAAPMDLDRRYLSLTARTVFFASASASAVTGLGLLLAYVHRRFGGAVIRWTIRLSTLGYALPGAVLAVGIVILVGIVDRGLVRAAQGLFGVQLSAVFQGTLLTVIFACTVRFLAAGYNGISGAMGRITRSLDEASALMGVTGFSMLRKVHVPILKNGLFTAGILVFVDVMKEMPITLMTRPFGWDTLAVKIFELTSEGEWHRAALPSVVLVLTGLVPTLLLNMGAEHASARSRE